MLFYPVSNICFAAEIPSLKDDPAILQNVIGRLMIQDIQKAVDDYYSDYTDYLPQVEVYSSKSTTKMLNLIYDIDNNVYIAVIEVKPYVTAHNTIGIDWITFEINGAGHIRVKDFKHIKSFEYPPWLNVKLKKPFPPNETNSWLS